MLALALLRVFAACTPMIAIGLSARALRPALDRWLAGRARWAYVGLANRFGRLAGEPTAVALLRVTAAIDRTIEAHVGRAMDDPAFEGRLEARAARGCGLARCALWDLAERRRAAA